MARKRRPLFGIGVIASVVARLAGKRAKRPPEPDDPPLAGVGAPLMPRTPLLSGGMARPIPKDDRASA